MPSVLQEVASPVATPRTNFEVGPMQPSDVADVARLHYGFIQTGEFRGHSIAALGLEFLEKVFYPLSLDNPYFLADVARYHGEVIGFIVYTSDSSRVFRETVKRHFLAVAAGVLKVFFTHPLLLMRSLLGNMKLVTDSLPTEVKGATGWGFLLGVKPEYRRIMLSPGNGVWPAGELWNNMEKRLRESGCHEIWTVVGEHNSKMQLLHRLQRMQPVAKGRAQGLPSTYYRKPLIAAPKQRRDVPNPLIIPTSAQ